MMFREAGLAQMATCTPALQTRSAPSPSQSKKEEGHTKYGQGSQKFAHVIGVQTEPHDRYDQSTRVVSNFDFTQ